MTKFFNFRFYGQNPNLKCDHSRDKHLGNGGVKRNATSDPDITSVFQSKWKFSAIKAFISAFVGSSGLETNLWKLKALLY